MLYFMLMFGGLLLALLLWVCGFSGLWLCCSMLLSGVVYCGLLVTCWVWIASSSCWDGCGFCVVTVF